MPYRFTCSLLIALLIAVLAPYTSRAEILAARQESYTAVPPTLPSLRFSGKVVAVKDGDFIVVLHDGRDEEIRLNGIDCPEKRQAFGQLAKRFTSTLVFGKDVTVIVYGHDKRGRTIGEVTLLHGSVLNHELVKAGLAWWFRLDAPVDPVLEGLEKEAREAKRGLWVDPNPIPPWEWRKLGRARGP